MLKREIEYFLAALTFYTRIPVPQRPDGGVAYLGESRKYLPAVGWVVAAGGTAVFLLFNMVLPAGVALLLSMAATLLATGAFHEDGFADACDAFGGGSSRRQVLEIMKDSRLGTFGVVGIVMLLAVKFAALYQIYQVSMPLMLASLFNAHAWSRLAASHMVQTEHYVGDPRTTKSKPVAAYRLNSGDMAFSTALAAATLVAFAPHWSLAWSVVPVYLWQKVFAGYCSRRIGGYTGDCLGATQQVGEVLMYLGILALCGFI